MKVMVAIDIRKLSFIKSLIQTLWTRNIYAQWHGSSQHLKVNSRSENKDMHNAT